MGSLAAVGRVYNRCLLWAAAVLLMEERSMEERASSKGVAGEGAADEGAADEGAADEGAIASTVNGYLSLRNRQQRRLQQPDHK